MKTTESDKEGLFVRLRWWVDAQMEAWGYSLLSAVLVIGMPALFFFKSTGAPTPADMRIVSGGLKQPPRIYRGDEDSSPFLELWPDASAVPVRFYDYGEIVLDAAALIAAKPRRVSIGIAPRDSGKLTTPPLYPPARWVEGHSLTADGKVYRTPEDGALAQSREARGFRWFAIGFVVLLAGVSLFAVLPDSKPAGEASPGPPVDPRTSAVVAKFYNVLIPGLLCLNLPVITRVHSWEFGGRYWLFFAGAVALLQSLLYLHHRRYLDIAYSQPRQPWTVPGSFAAYLLASVLLAFMLTPAIQYAHRSMGLRQFAWAAAFVVAAASVLRLRLGNAVRVNAIAPGEAGAEEGGPEAEGEVDGVSYHAQLDRKKGELSVAVALDRSFPDGPIIDGGEEGAGIEGSPFAEELRELLRLGAGFIIIGNVADDEASADLKTDSESIDLDLAEKTARQLVRIRRKIERGVPG